MRTETFGQLTCRIAGGPDREGGGDGPVVVLLHGFGAPGDDLVGLWRVLDVPSDVRFVFPAAPITFSMGFGESRAWWMIEVGRYDQAMREGRLDEMTEEIPEGLAEARAIVNETLDTIEQRLQPRQLVLGGFSQGAMVALDVALRGKRPLAGLALMSATLLAAPEWRELMPARAGLPTMQSHGRQDPLLPFQIATRLRDELVGAGIDVDWIEFNGGHEIPLSTLEKLGRLICAAGATER